jgi:hypothetical protein
MKLQLGHLSLIVFEEARKYFRELFWILKVQNNSKYVEYILIK